MRGFAVALASAALLVTGAARAGLVTEKVAISEQGCRFPDVAFGKDRFLVVWADYVQRRVCGRFVRDDASPVAPPFCISEPAAKSALFPSVAYARVLDQYLVTWDDEGRGDGIHGQRIAANGGLIGANFAIGGAGTIRSSVAFCEASQRWLVVHAAPTSGSDVQGRLVDAMGAPLLTLDLAVDPIFAGYPSVACANDRFLVTWDHEDGNIRARTVHPVTGALSPVSTITSGGGKDRSQATFDPLRARFVVQFNDQVDKAFSYDQFARFVSLDGNPIGAPFAIAHEPVFEGDTQFGGDLAVLPSAQRMLSSFGTETGINVQELDLEGVRIGTQVVLGTGNYTSLSNAADDASARVLTAWEGLDPPDAQHRILVRVFETSRSAAEGDAGVDAGMDASPDAARDSTSAAAWEPDAASPTGCGCRTAQPRAPSGFMLALLLGFARRRRRDVP